MAHRRRLAQRELIAHDPAKAYEERPPDRGQRAADAVASFDPYPYILLNLFLSMLAAIQAPVILMSQNRQAQKDRATAGHDYEVNLKAELEIMLLHDKLDHLREQQWAELLAALAERPNKA